VTAMPVTDQGLSWPAVLGPRGAWLAGHGSTRAEPAISCITHAANRLPWTSRSATTKPTAWRALTADLVDPAGDRLSAWSDADQVALRAEVDRICLMSGP